MRSELKLAPCINKYLNSKNNNKNNNVILNYSSSAKSKIASKSPNFYKFEADSYLADIQNKIINVSSNGRFGSKDPFTINKLIQR
jgi:hypothetical protein